MKQVMEIVYICYNYDVLCLIDLSSIVTCVCCDVVISM